MGESPHQQSVSFLEEKFTGKNQIGQLEKIVFNNDD
jgi:hypothetical protein